MRILKMTIGILSLLLFTACFAAATPMAQQQKTSPLDETTHQVASAYQPDKKLNFIQKVMLKKSQKRMKKASDEDKYRTWAELSIISGVFAILPLVGLFFMLLSMILGVRAIKKSQDEKTKKMARIGFLLGMFLFALGIGLIILWINGSSFGVSWGW